MDRGYTGKILIVNLSNGDIYEEVIPDEIYEKYLSGIGLAAYVSYRKIPAGADPLGPDNLFGIVSGLLTGTGSLFTGRWMATGKSPLTGGWGDANCGGTLSPMIKRCGYDGVFVTGSSDKPVYIQVGEDFAEIKDASDTWGKDAVEAEKILIKSTGVKGTKVACIGPAGENLSLISGISNDRGRMAARSGLGAVMGSKKLKAVVFTGKKKIYSNDPDEIKKLRIKTLFYVNAQPPFTPGALSAYLGAAMRMVPGQMAIDGMLYKIMLKKWGTISMNQMSVELGDSPIKNWEGTNEDFGIEKSKTINPDLITKCEIKKYYCYSCPLGCGGICSVNSPEYDETHKPEYETVLALTGLCLNEDLDSVFYINEILNRAGMDSISAGATVAFAIECYEKGILTDKDTDGLELRWGEHESMIELIKKMVDRDGIGDILADGVKKAAERIGKGADQFAVHAGGQELGMHDSRYDPGFAVHYSVEPTPGRHTMGSLLYYDMYQLWHKVKSLPRLKFFFHKDSKYVPDEEKAIKTAACSKFMNIANGAGLCMFGAFLGVHRLPIFEWLNAATGWDKTPEDYMEIGERVQTIKQAFNVKHGIKPRQYKVSERALGKPSQKTGANKGRSVQIEKMMSDYWIQFGWDYHSGQPTQDTIDRLEMYRELDDASNESIA